MDTKRIRKGKTEQSSEKKVFHFRKEGNGWQKMRKKSESDPDEQKSGKTSKRTEIQQQQKDLRGYRSQEGSTKDV